MIINEITHNLCKLLYVSQIEDVFNEIKHLNSVYDVKTFMFTDGSFEDSGILGKEHIREFCEKIIKEPVKYSFRCYLRAESFSEDDLELIQLMKKAGFSQVYLGIES